MIGSSAHRRPRHCGNGEKIDIAFVNAAARSFWIPSRLYEADATAEQRRELCWRAFTWPGRPAGLVDERADQ
jgi:hypothetical protein